MPNHISNELTAPVEVLDFMASADDRVFDFNNILPMPAVLRDRQPHTGVIDFARVAMGVCTLNDLSRPTGNASDAIKAGNWGAATASLQQMNTIRMLREGPYPKDYSDKDFEEFLNCCRAIKETGYTYWHDFSREKWGTKWNAYRAVRKSPTVVTFQTAWSAPLPVVVAIAAKFPKAKMRLRWADEDFGNNGGVIDILGDDVTGGPLENGSRDAKELALELVDSDD